MTAPEPAKIVPVILSGGAGTRLWPLSHAGKPKQFHALAGSETMLQMTARRVADPGRFAAPVVVANAAHRGRIEQQLATIDAIPQAIILEPAGRNTAAAIALAALEAAPEDLLLIMPSDHVIGRPDRFLEAIERAARPASEGWLITFGIAPDRAETGYGYIKRGAPMENGIFVVDRFVEKPDLETATSYVREGGYQWNGGIFLFRADALLDGLATYAADILEEVRTAHRSGARQGNVLAPDADAFARVRGQSIDHALMEVHDRVAVVPVEMDWSDLGSWDALYDIGGKDADGNSVAGLTHLRDTKRCLIRSTGPRVVTIGVEDLIVVATGDTILILPRGESQRVKEAAEALSAGRR